MRTIHKLPLPSVPGKHVIKMPALAEVLHADNQHDVPTLWALVDLDEDLIDYDIYILGTGDPLPNIDIYHVGSVLIHRGTLVLHIFLPYLDDEVPVSEQRTY